MSSDQFRKRLAAKSFRVRRHLAALSRYATAGRLANVVRVETERLLKRDRLSGRPYMLLVDPTNVCNLKCPLCPTGRGDLPLKNGKMPLDSFRAFIDQIAPHTLKIMLYNWGEPFLHKDILEMIAHAHKRRIATALSSNLNRLPKAGAEAVVRSGLDDMIVSCDGLSQETYETYRVGGKLEDVLANMRAIAETRKRLGRKSPVIEFQFLVFEHNEHEVPEVERTARANGADFVRVMPPYIGKNKAGIQPARDPYFRRNYSEEDEPDPFERDADLDTLAARNPPPLSCFWPWRSMVVNWNGQADPCCFKNYHQPFGNVFEQPFDEVWNNDIYRYSRRWIAGKAQNDSRFRIVCRGCKGYG